MKIKYTVVYELETELDTNYGISSMGAVKRLHHEHIKARYEENEVVKIISNNYEIVFKGNALDMSS